MADHNVTEDEQTANSSAGTGVHLAGSHTGEMGRYLQSMPSLVQTQNAIWKIGFQHLRGEAGTSWVEKEMMLQRPLKCTKYRYQRRHMIQGPHNQPYHCSHEEGPKKVSAPRLRWGGASCACGSGPDKGNLPQLA